VQRETLTGQLSEATERALARYSKGTRAKKTASAKAPKAAADHDEIRGMPSPLKATYRGKDPGIMHLVFLLRPMPMATPRGDLVGQVLPQIQRRRPCSALSGPNIGRQNRPL
jgi:hypothetical protein